MVTAEFVSASLEYNFTEVKNRITVWGENFDGASFVAVAENDNPKSPVRVSFVGYRVAVLPQNKQIFPYVHE